MSMGCRVKYYMASRADKGEEVAVASKGLKRLRKEVASSSSAQKAPLLGGLEPRPWRRMDSSGLMPKGSKVCSRELD
ncbi:hypothetical protein HAX54_012130 [Datura stramonium]|uniref:Uncharacterized protein n=1 Tax=Datura stramonium TaxID=4076 RepID=A0ABS8RXG7_DATST|nr:hypothetical protein [Datura stramonium]